jgi:uncharacterized membrane protein
MFLFTSATHFSKIRRELARMMASIFPNPMALVYFTGVCEIFGAIGILVPRTRSFAGLCLFVFLLAILPANVKAARERPPSAAALPPLFNCASPCKFFSWC